MKVMKIRLDNEPVNHLIGRIDMILKDGSHFTIWSGYEHIVLSSNENNIFITPIDSNSIMVESESE